MIHSSRVDRVRSRHLGRIRTQEQWKCHQPISIFSGCFDKGGRRTECALFALTAPTLPRSRNVVERATAVAVVPPTIVKIMTLDCHAALEVNAIPSSTARVQQPSASRVPAMQSLSAGLAQGVLYSPSLCTGVEQHEHQRFDISVFRFSNATVCACDGLSTTLCRPVGARAKESFAHNSASDLGGTGIRTKDCIQHRSWHAAF
jgi:hypothetical protein